jgi:hypothetical protein
MSKVTDDHNLSDREKRFKSWDRGSCGIGCLVIIVLFFGIGVVSMYMTTPQIGGDDEKVVQDIYRYQKTFGSWPKSLEELKKKLPDYQFEHRYSYLNTSEMFIVSYTGSGMLGDDYGEFYRSDTKEWKNISSNRKELIELKHKLRPMK